MTSCSTSSAPFAWITWNISEIFLKIWLDVQPLLCRRLAWECRSWSCRASSSWWGHHQDSNTEETLSEEKYWMSSSHNKNQGLLPVCTEPWLPVAHICTRNHKLQEIINTKLYEYKWLTCIATVSSSTLILLLQVLKKHVVGRLLLSDLLHRNLIFLYDEDDVPLGEKMLNILLYKCPLSFKNIIPVLLAFEYVVIFYFTVIRESNTRHSHD